MVEPMDERYEQRPDLREQQLPSSQIPILAAAAKRFDLIEFRLRRIEKRIVWRRMEGAVARRDEAIGACSQGGERPRIQSASED